MNRRLIRALAGLGGLWGLALLVRPEQVAAALCPEFPRSRLWVARVLGARLVAQSAVVLAVPDRRPVRVTAAVEALHATSMVPLLGSPRYRRAAVISGGWAAGYAATAAALAPPS
ncbi:hypothetical protein [Geodermatophilus sp. URMC 64]